MLDKTSKRVYEKIKELHDPDKPTVHFRKIADELGMNFRDVISTCEYLERQGYIESYYNRGTPGGPAREGVRLLHESKHEKEFSRLRFWKYIRKNWIAIIALVLSLIALIVSIQALRLQQLELRAKQLSLSLGESVDASNPGSSSELNGS